MKILFTLAGIAVSLFALFLLMAGNSYFADFRSRSIAGFGTDIFLYDKFPAEGGLLPIEVSVRGGSAIGIKQITITSGEKIIAEKFGEGVTWGRTLSSKSRANEEMYFDLPVSEITQNGHIEFSVQASAVAAMSSGASSFTNESMTDRVEVVMPLFTSGQKFFGRMKFLLFSIFNLVIWFGFNWYMMKWYKTKVDDGGYEKDKGIELVMFLLGGSMLGYFVFTRLLAGAFGFTSVIFTIFSMLVWIAAGIYPIIKAEKKYAYGGEKSKLPPPTQEEIQELLKRYEEIMKNKNTPPGSAS